MNVPVRCWVGLTALALFVVVLTSPGCSLWRTLFPARIYETEPPALPPASSAPAVLLFTKTNGYRHHEAIAKGVPFFEELARRRGWALFHTENGAVHREALLERFDVVVWFQTSGDTLDEDQKAALRGFIEGGGGFVAIHGAGGDPSYDWDWYVDDLIGAQFVGHTMDPQFQSATLLVEDTTHPATASLPDRFEHTEEWYSFASNPRARGARVLIAVDESTYTRSLGWLSPFMSNRLTMGDHPIVWSHCPGEGRALFSALGHQAASYDMPEHRLLLEEAVAWGAGLHGRACDDTLGPDPG